MDLTALSGWLGQVGEIVKQVSAIAVVVVPLLSPLVLPLMQEARRQRLLAATRAAYNVTAELAARTHLSAADGLARVLRLVSDELGKTLSKSEEDLVTRMAAAMHSDVSMPGSLGSGVGDALLPPTRRK